MGRPAGATGSYDLRSTYTILAAGGALTGEFDDVSSDFAFLTPNLIYDYAAGTVDLTLERNDQDFASVARTRNQRATAKGMESIGIGAGHAVYDAIARLPDDGDLIRASFDALSGEIHASAKSALLEDSRFLRDAVNDRLRMTFNHTGERAALSTSGTGRYAVWARPFGSWGGIDSDGNAATLDTSTGGIFLGADGAVSEHWRLGVLAGYSHTAFDVDARQSSGSSDSYHLSLYGGAQWRNLGLRAGLAHSWHDIGTKRSADFRGFSDRLHGGYHARTVQAFSELAYRIDTGAVSLEPFANLAYVNLRTGGFTESGGPAALSGTRETTETTFATVGLRASTSFTLGAMPAQVRGLLGWRHAFGDITPLSRHTLAGSDTFTIAGAPIAKNAFLVNAGLDLNVTDNAALGLSYAGQLGAGAQQHGVVANFTMKF